MHHSRRKWVVLLNGLSIIIGLTGMLAASPAGDRLVSPASVRVGRESSDAGIEPAIPFFRAHCVECHDLNGRGDTGRELMRRTPDFTDPEWHRARGDRDLTRSIVKGKGAMPATKAKLAAEQLDRLVRLVRSFRGGRFQIPEETDDSADQDSTAERTLSGTAPPGAQAELAAAEFEEPIPPRQFSQKLLRWLGNFHPPAVHYPIAMLIAAAVAELLRLVTGKPAFDTITRFCVWFGALTAGGAGALGWCLAGLPAGDESWVMIMHRWIGTSTVILAGLLLALCEASHRRDHPQIRVWFRLSLFAGAALVSVAGFTGGAVVFGLNHYAWPPR